MTASVFRTRISAIALVAVFCLNPLGVTAHASQPLAAPAPLASHVQADGTLDTSSVGTFDPSGYTLQLGAGGEPRFVATGDAGWDDRFGPPGVYEGEIEAAVVAANGDLYVAGSFNAGNSGVAASQVARWDGQRWYPLGEGLTGGLERVRQLAVSGNNLYAVGSFTQAGSSAAKQIARWDGAQWHAVGTGSGPQQRDTYGVSDGYIYSVAAAPDGTIYVGGTFNYIDDTPANGIARWDGSQWRALGNGLSERMSGDGSDRYPATVLALAIAADGALYAGGEFSDAGTVQARNIARWNGATWQALGSGVGIGNGYDYNSRVEAIALDGATVYVGGLIDRAGSRSVANVAAWDGSTWRALGSGLAAEFDSPSPVLSLAAKDGVVYAGGTFNSAGGQAISNLARWNGSAWSAVGEPLSLLGSRVEVRALVFSPAGGLYAGGSFNQAGSNDVYGISLWNGQRWENLGQGAALVGNISAQVYAVAIDGSGRVYVGGFLKTVGGLPVNNVAMWDGTRWHALGGGVTGGDGYVSALLAVGNDVYVGGQFTQAGGQSASHIARWNSTSQSWHALGGGIDGWVTSLAYGDGRVYAGGSFNSAGGTPALDIASWDGTRWQALGGGWEIFEVLDSGAEAGTFVQALAYHNGELYIGGHFQTLHARGASSQDPSSYVAVHNVAGYTPASQEWYSIGSGGAAGVTTNGYSGFSTSVEALAVVDNGLFIGGTFNRGGGLYSPNLARWDLATGVWSSPGAPAGESNVTVSALAGFGATLVVGGSFSSLGSSAANSVAMLNTATGQWSIPGSGIQWSNGQSRVYAVAVGANGIFFGGEFSQAGPHPSLGVAQYRGGFGSNPNLTYRVYVPTVMR